MVSTYDEARRAGGGRASSELVVADDGSEYSQAPHCRQAGWLEGAFCYDGLTAIGRTIPQPSGHHLALDAVGQPLGRFPSHRTATTAIVTAHRGEGRAA